MNLTRILLTVLSIGLLIPAVAGAQGFESGSDGSYGPIFIARASGTETLDVPEDGIFHATTITVEAGATLRFNRNELNTPVYLLATGDVEIAGTVDVNGSASPSGSPIPGFGGPGGFDGGVPGIEALPPGDGQGPGAGLAGDATITGNVPEAAGSGSFGSRPSRESETDGDTYGSPLLVPLVGGSGGGGGAGQPGRGGAGGGGAILIASNTGIHLDNTITARGGSNSSHNNHGSGGAIRLVAPAVFGDGVLEVRGGNSGEEAGRGRVRIDTIDRSGIDFDFRPDSAASIGAFMAVFPEPLPRLDIIEVAGELIPEGQTTGTLVFLPFGADPNRTVIVQGRDFEGEVPIEVVLTPDSGGHVVYDATIDMNAGNPATVEVDVELPINTTTQINAWTK